MRRVVLSGLISALAFQSSVANAELTWSGFLTAAGAASNVKFLDTGVEPLYLGYVGKQISFDKDSVLGMQLVKKIDESFSATGQLVVAGKRDWDVHATRAFFKYSPTDNWHWKMGRVPVDYLIHSEDVFESNKYPWITLPESLYDMIPFHYLDGVSGGVKYNFWKRKLKLKATYGALSEHTTTPITDVEFKYKLRQLINLVGTFGDDVLKIHGSFSVGRLTWGPNATNELTNTFINNTLVGGGLLGLDYQNYLSVVNERIQYQSLGYSLQWRKLISYSELLRRKSGAAIVPNLNAWYVMFGVRHLDLIPYVSFARQRITDNHTRRFSGAVNAAALAPIPGGLGNTLDVVLQNVAEGIDGPAAGNQSSYTAGVQWNVIDKVAVKASVEHIHPDKNSSGLFNIAPHKSVNIYRIGVDTSFEA
ncbi:MAG: hypothetical protein AB7D28_02645 [Candidatus Berkiella sp.]